MPLSRRPRKSLPPPSRRSRTIVADLRSEGVCRAVTEVLRAQAPHRDPLSCAGRHRRAQSRRLRHRRPNCRRTGRSQRQVTQADRPVTGHTGGQAGHRQVTQADRPVTGHTGRSQVTYRSHRPVTGRSHRRTGWSQVTQAGHRSHTGHTGRSQTGHTDRSQTGHRPVTDRSPRLVTQADRPVRQVTQAATYLHSTEHG